MYSCPVLMYCVLLCIPPPPCLPAQNMEKIVAEADIVIAAAGQAQLIKGSWLKPGAVVIDVGTNAVDDPTKKAGYRLVGDADYDSCKQVAGAITPVPGGWAGRWGARGGRGPSVWGGGGEGKRGGRRRRLGFKLLLTAA